MSARTGMAHVGALAAVVGGALGLYLLTQGPNAYGNYPWDGRLASLTVTLLVVGFGSAYAVQREHLQRGSWVGLGLALGGLVLMGLGYAIDELWPFIFFGPLMLVPLGFIWLGVSLYHRTALAPLWRILPLAVGVLALLGLGIELWEEMRGGGPGDWGLTLAQAVLALAGIGLGLGLWLNLERPDHDAGRVA